MKKIALLMVTIIIVSGLGLARVSSEYKVSEQEEIYHDLYQGKSFKTIDEGAVSDYRHNEGFNGENLVIKNEEDWQKFWEDHTNGLSTSSLEVPQVNFEKNMVLLAIMGSQNTGGYEIQIKNIYEVACEITLAKYQESEPEPGSIVKMWGTNPYHFVVTEKTDQIMFSKIEPEEDRSGHEIKNSGKTDLIPY